MQNLMENIILKSEYRYFIRNFRDMPGFEKSKLLFFMLSVSRTDIDIGELIKKLEKRYTRIGDVRVQKLFKEQGIDYFSLSFKGVIKGIQLQINSILQINLEDKSALIVTESSNNAEQKAIIYFINKSYPLLKNMFVPSYSIKALVKGLIKEGYVLTSPVASIKRWWKRAEKHTLGGSLEFPKNAPVEDFISDIEKRDAFLNAIRINIHDKAKSRTILTFYISRSGLVKFIDGDIEYFETKILEPILDICKTNIKLYENRQRSVNKVKPLKLIFDESLMNYAEKEVRENFANVISKMRDYKIAVYHSGNPYFQSSLVDTKDGSVFDLLFYDIKKDDKTKYEMIVIPQFNISSIALNRLFSNLFSKFGEGKLEEWAI